MSKAPSPPQPVNPFQVGGAQQQSNINSAIAGSALNDINQVTPYGTVTYTFGTPAGGDLNLGKPPKSGNGGGGGGGMPILRPTSFTPAPAAGGGGGVGGPPSPGGQTPFQQMASQKLYGGTSPIPGAGLAALLNRNGGQ